MEKLKLSKIVASLLVSVSVIALKPIGASAEWKQDSNGWWNTEDSSYSIGWRLIDNSWYYFGNDGYMKTGWIYDKGNWYYLYDSGAMAKNMIIDGYSLDLHGAWIQSDNDTSYKDLDKLPSKYNSEEAQQNGDVVQILGDIQYNIDKLNKFIENYHNKKASIGDMIRITSYGDEGGVTISDLIINSDGSIKLKEDNTRDWFSSDKDRIIKEYKVVDIYTRDNTSGYRTYYMKTNQGKERFLGNSDIH